MKINLTHKGKRFTVDLNSGVDLSIPFAVDGGLNAYHAPKVQMDPVRMGDWVGEVSQGAPVNYRNVSFNPHGNGTHTECVGHIDKDIHSINRNFREFHCLAQIFSIEPMSIEGMGRVIMPDQLPKLEGVPAVIIRTLPNDPLKRSLDYSGSDPAYLNHETVVKLVGMGCRHLILDLPSVDREEDGGKLLGHRAFWNYPELPRMDCTITELAYIPDSVDDGIYLLNLQVAPFENDAAPSRPVVYSLIHQ
jgi:arylformamidase